MLCISGAFLYGISNVAEEYVVKSYSIVEFLGMIGLFGSVVNGLQLWVKSEYINSLKSSQMPVVKEWLSIYEHPC